MFASWLARFLIAAAAFCISAVIAIAQAPPAPQEPTYGQSRDFLARHTKLIELTGEGGVRVAICPEYQGRVMTSTCQGLEGASLGWINRVFIEAGDEDEHFNNYGGEDRFWLGPEAGQFGLWFAPDEAQILDHWLTPPALNDGAFKVVERAAEGVCRMQRRMKLQNAAKTAFHIDVTRTVRLLGPAAFANRFGTEAAQAASGLSCVGFESENVVTNRGRSWNETSGLLAVWILGMFPPDAETVILVPYRPGPVEALGPIVQNDYFGELPADRWKVLPEAVLFSGDGQWRAKIGISRRRARPLAGSIDFRRGVLTLVSYTMPDNPTEKPYVNNTWKLPQEEPFDGDVFNSYNDGPPEPGARSLGGFYELETMSPAAELNAGESFSHVHRTFHLTGELPALAAVARAALGIDLAAVRAAMLEKK